jgi:hypothetical protein
VILHRIIEGGNPLSLPPGCLPFPLLHFRRGSLGATGAPLPATPDGRLRVIEGTPVRTATRPGQVNQFPISAKPIVTAGVIDNPTARAGVGEPTERLEELPGFGNVHWSYSNRLSIVVKVNLVTSPGLVFPSHKFTIVIFLFLKLAGVSEFDGDTGSGGNDGDSVRPSNLKVRTFGSKRPGRSVVGEEVGRKGDVHRGDKVTDSLKKVKRF